MRSTLRPPLVFLGGLIAALAGVVVIEGARPWLDPPAHAAQPRNAGQQAAPGPEGASGFTMPPLSSFAEVLARPLFSPSRRPAPPSARPADPRASNFAAVGIVISGESRSALLEHGQPPHLDHVLEGQTIDGWRVEQILSDRVVLSSGADRVEIYTKDAPPGAVPPANGMRRGTPQPAAPIPPANLMGLPLGQLNAPQPGPRR